MKKGSLIKSSIGQLQILDISEANQNNLTKNDAHLSGYQSLSQLLSSIDSGSIGTLYRIVVRYHSPDPRIELRNKTGIHEEELNEIIAKLNKFDKNSNQGIWVRQVLFAIQNYPELRAVELAQKVQKPKDWLKINIRKLKNLGLTISHEKGYTLSPRGKVVLEKIY